MVFHDHRAEIGPDAFRRILVVAGSPRRFGGGGGGHGDTKYSVTSLPQREAVLVVS